jgi:hypothetical protein
MSTFCCIFLTTTTTTPSVAGQSNPLYPLKKTYNRKYSEKRSMGEKGTDTGCVCVSKKKRYDTHTHTLLHNKAGREKFPFPSLLPPPLSLYIYNFPCHQRHKTARLNTQPLFIYLGFNWFFSLPEGGDYRVDLFTAPSSSNVVVAINCVYTGRVLVAPASALQSVCVWTVKK